MSVDKSVWFEQVDRALITLLGSTLSVTNEDGEVVPVRAIVRKPDEDFREEDFPLASIYGLYQTFSKDRFSNDRVVLSKNEQEHSITLENSAVPYDLTYQIDLWASSQVDMNDMTREWLTSVPVFSNLSVTDLSGASRTCFMQMVGNAHRQDELKGGSRVFHTVMTYKIGVELDSGATTTMPMVTEHTAVTNP